MSQARAADAGGVSIHAWVTPDVAEGIHRLAAEGDRSVSREAARALRAHIEAHDEAAADRDGVLAADGGR